MERYGRRSIEGRVGRPDLLDEGTSFSITTTPRSSGRHPDLPYSRPRFQVGGEVPSRVVGQRTVADGIGACSFPFACQAQADPSRPSPDCHHCRQDRTNVGRRSYPRSVSNAGCRPDDRLPEDDALALPSYCRFSHRRLPAGRQPLHPLCRDASSGRRQS